MREYFVYFPFFKPQSGGKRFAAQPQTIDSEFPLIIAGWVIHPDELVALLGRDLPVRELQGVALVGVDDGGAVIVHGPVAGPRQFAVFQLAHLLRLPDHAL